jgi:Ca-activated chloride channel family protein
VSALNLGAPWALLGLLAALPLLGAWWFEARAARRADATYGGDETLRLGRARGWTRARRALVLLAVALAAVGAARPQWGATPSPVERQGIDVVIALDISRSMQATDVQPSRAGLAARGLSEMLRHLGGDRVGLVSFAGTAFARSPLTLDTDAVADLVSRAQREGALVGPGTDVGAAITTALRLLDVPDRAATRAIVLISDGEDLGATLNDAITAAQRAQVRVYTVAAGTEAGALVPAGEGARGPAAEVVSRADRASLARIADATGGSTRDAASLAGLAVDLARLQQSALDAGQHVVPIERLHWPLLGAVALLLVATLIPEGARTAPHGTSRRESARRATRTARAAGVASTALLAAFILGCGGTPTWRKVDEGNAEFARGRFAQALGAYAQAKQSGGGDPAIDYNIGNTLHRLDRLDDAIAASKAAATATKDGVLFARATYAAASSAFRRGNLPDARDGFVAVLQRDPTDEDARHNLEVVLRALARTAPPQQSGQQGQQPGQPGAQPSGTPGASGQGGGQPQPNATPSGPPQGGAPQPGASGQPGTGRPAPGTAEAERAADEALRRAVAGLPENVSPEQALGILDAARAASEAGTLRRPNATPNPNDR